MQRVPTYRPSLEEALGGKPTKAEEKVLAAAKAGEWAELSPFGIRPYVYDDNVRIRAALIRFLMLGGDPGHPVQPSGVMVHGAWIAGKLNLEACETQLDLKLFACRFDTAPDFDDAHLGGLYLPGCHLPGLSGRRMRLEKSLHLRVLTRADDPPLPFEATGTVDVSGARISGDLTCSGGRFDGAGDIAIDGSALVVQEDVFLNDGFHAAGSVNLIRARITGQLTCEGGRFDGAGRQALNGDTMTVGVSVFLRDGFRATGEVNLSRAEVTGNLRVMNAQIEGLLRLDSASVGKGLFFRNLSGDSFDGPWPKGKMPPSSPNEASSLRIDLTEAEAGVLVDDATSWEQARTVRLSGFRFRSVQSRMTVAERVKLLDRSNQAVLAVTATGKRHFPDGAADFDPRAYGELARAYVRQGERRAAAQVLEAREDRSRDAELRRAQAEEMPGSGMPMLGAWLRWLSEWFFKSLFGYGYRLERVFVTLIPLWIVLTLFFGTVYDKGQFAPNSDVILTSTEWQDAVKAGCPLPKDELFPAKKADGCDMPLTLWAGDFDRNLVPANAAKDYETFGRLLYAADLFLPLDAIGQTEAWAPSKDRGNWGWWAYYLRFPVQILGWLFTALFAKVISDLLIRRED